MAIKVSSTTVIDDNRKGIFNRCNPGTFTNSNRPSSPSAGDIIYNSEEEELQVYSGTEWTSAGSGGEKGTDGGTISSGNGTIQEPTPTSPTPNATGVARYIHVEYNQYVADLAKDPFEAYEVVFSYDETFADLIYYAREETITKLGMYSTILADPLSTVYVRLTFLSTSGNRAEKMFSYTADETFEGSFFSHYYGQSYSGSVSLTVPANQTSLAKFYLLTGYGTSGNAGKNTSCQNTFPPGNINPSQSAGDAYVRVILNQDWETGGALWSGVSGSGATYTFSNDYSSYSGAYDLFGRGGKEAYYPAGGSQLSYSAGDGGGGLTDVDDIIQEWNDQIKPYHLQLGTGGTVGERGYSPQNTGGYGGSGGGGGMLIIKTNIAENEVVGSYDEPLTPVQASTGGTGGCVYHDPAWGCAGPNYASGGAGGTGGTGYGAGGGGGGGNGGTDHQGWAHKCVSTSSGGGGLTNYIFVIAKVAAPANFRNASVATETDLANLDRTTLLPRESIEIVDTGETAIYSPGRDEFIIYNVPNNVTLARNI